MITGVFFKYGGSILLLKKELQLYIYLLLMAASKFYIFNIFTDNRGKSLLLIFVSLLYFFFIVYKFIKKPMYIFAFYVLISLIMFVDLINFKYFNTYTSINSAGNISQLGAIKDTILNLIQWKDFLLFFDIPFSFYLVNSIKPLDLSFWNKNYKKGVNIISAVCFLGVMINPMDIDAIKVIQNREIISYRIHDVYSAINSGKSYDFYDELSRFDNSLIDEPGDFFGVAEERNLIVIQVESLQNFVINQDYNGQEITPVMNSLTKNDSFYFSNYYQQLGLGNTSDAEFITNNSIYPTTSGQAYQLYQDNEFYGIPWQLKENGYATMAFHGHDKSFWNREKAYSNQGFDIFYHEDYFKIKENIGFGLGDYDFFEQSIPYLKKSDKLFYAFMVTLSSHNPYTVPDRHKNLNLLDEDKDTYFGDYLYSLNYTDKSIGHFIDLLKENNLYDNSVIAIYGDHFGLGAKDQRVITQTERFINHDYDFDEMLKVPLIIHIPGMGHSEERNITGGQVDFLPTIFNLMGHFNKNPFVFGRDLLNSNQGFAASQTYMVKGSFMKDGVLFEMSRDGVFRNSRAMDTSTRKDTDVFKYKEDSDFAVKEINLANYVLENNLIRREWGENDKEIYLGENIPGSSHSEVE